MLHRTLVALALLLNILPLAACEQAAVARPAPTTITVAGSTAMHPVLRALTDEFTRRHPQVLFDLRGGGSTLGEDWVRDGQVDIAADTVLAVVFTVTMQ